MRVLFIHDYGYFLGGAEVYAYELACALGKRGHQVRWFTSTSRGGGSMREVGNGAPRFHDDFICHGVSSESSMARGLQQVFNPSARYAVKNALNLWRPDVVHLHSYLGRLSPAILEPLARYPTVATLHNYRAVCPKGTKVLPDNSTCSRAWGWNCVASHCVPAGAFLQETIKRALWGSPLASIRRLLAPSRFMKRVVERETALPVDHFPGATDLHEHRRPKKNGKARLLYVGRLAAAKGVEVLLSALPSILKRVPEVSLTVAGEGPDRPALQTQARSLRVENHVRFLGHCAKAELPLLHAESDLAIVPSLWPSTGSIAIIEAMALGTPVIATAIGGAPELVKEGLNGRLVPPGDAESLADAIAGLIARPQRRKSMERGCLLTAENYRMADAVEGLERIYAEALGLELHV